MSELEDIGRYHQIHDSLVAEVARRNSALSRVSMVLSTAAQSPVSRYNLARTCRFDAIDRLLEEAKASHAEIERLLEEMRVLGPVVNKPVPTLE